MMATAALVSNEPSIINPPPAGIPLPNPLGILHFEIINADLRPQGEQRESVVMHMYQEALKAAKEESIILEVSKENAASCFLLDFLEQGSGASI
jgi:hypothetical protein